MSTPLSIVIATNTCSDEILASPAGVRDTPTSVLDSDSADTTDDSSDSVGATPTDVESSVESDEDDELVRQIIDEIRKNGLQPRGESTSRTVTTTTATKAKRTSNPMKQGRPKTRIAGPERTQEKLPAIKDTPEVRSTGKEVAKGVGAQPDQRGNAV